MPLTYFPCRYIDAESIPCGQFYPESSDYPGHFCLDHRKITEITENKPIYIDKTNLHRKFCHEMTLPELDAHIAGIESEIAELKIKYYSARAARGEKLEKLSDADREIRRQHKYTAPSKETTSIKKDPIAHLGKKLGVNSSDAKDLMNLDVDALLAKFSKAKESNV